MEEKDYKTLWWKIAVAILSFSLIPLFALGIAIYYQFSISYTAKVVEDLKTLVENQRSAIDLFFDERVSQLVTLAHTHTLEQLSDERHLATMFNTMQTRSKSFIDIGIIDRKGNHVAYVGPYPELKGVNYRKEDWFQSVFYKGVYISDVAECLPHKRRASADRPARTVLQPVFFPPVAVAGFSQLAKLVE
ncbi:MAG: cache domain-containing protein [Bryobacteraceae bacterium]